MKHTRRGFKNVIWQVAPVLLVSLAVAGNAYGTPPTVVDLSTLMPNPSFELGNQLTAPGNQVGCPLDWTCGGSPSPGGTSYTLTGAQYVAGSDGLPSPLIVPNGSNVGQCPTLLAGSCTLYALNLGTYQANTTYTLTLWVGTPLTVQNCGGAPGCSANVSPAYPVSRVTAYLLGNGNAQFAATNISVPAPGQWQKVPLSFTPAGYQIGQTINFLIFASTSQGYQQVNFDIDPPGVITCPAISNVVPAHQNTAFDVSVTGGTPPYNFSIGQNPSVLTLTAAPNTPTSYSIAIINPSNTSAAFSSLNATDALGIALNNLSCRFGS